MLEWLQNPIVSIAFAIGLMFFGYFFGLFEGRGQGYKRRQEEEAEKKETKPVAEEPAPAVPVVSSDETPVLDVSKDKSGELRLMLDGQHTDPSSLSMEQRKRLIEVLTMIRPWLESPKSARPAQPKPASSPREARPPAAIPSPEPSPASTAASRPASPPPVSEDSAPAASSNSIVAQIDSILQAHIAGTPLVERGIRLQESPEGGVIVWVGIDKFQGVEDVPDENIKAAIRAAIAQWENKYTSGT
ncbi:MAG: hypothetical protein PVJ21_05815 [Anaerolineales bacterium]|jgi:hypothetical protein